MSARYQRTYCICIHYMYYVCTCTIEKIVHLLLVYVVCTCILVRLNTSADYCSFLFLFAFYVSLFCSLTIVQLDKETLLRLSSLRRRCVGTIDSILKYKCTFSEFFCLTYYVAFLSSKELHTFCISTFLSQDIRITTCRGPY